MIACLARNQRLLMFALALVVAVAAFVALKPSSKETHATDNGAEVLLTGASVKDIKVNKGDIVRLAARSPTADEIHVHGYDLKKDAPAGRTVHISFPAKIEGVFEVEFENAGKQIASLTVQP